MKQKELIKNNNLLCYFKFTPLQWSRFKLYQYPNLLLLQCTVKLETKSLTVPDLSIEHSSRLSEVWDLSELGVSTSEISKIFNEKGYQRKYVDKPYTQKDISMMRIKYRKQLNRISNVDVEQSKWTIQWYRI